VEVDMTRHDLTPRGAVQLVEGIWRDL